VAGPEGAADMGAVAAAVATVVEVATVVVAVARAAGDCLGAEPEGG
jgi:hypothetical protein